MKAFRLAFPLVLSLAIASNSLAASIVNGSFEAPDVTAGSFTVFPFGSTGITGWTVIGSDVAVVSGTFSQGGITFQAQSGNQWIDLAGETSNSGTNGVQQGIATTVGQAYEVSFYVGSAQFSGVFAPSTIDLSINGGPRTSYFNPAAPTTMLDWKLFTVPFTATSSTTTLTFSNGSASLNYLAALDNVSIATVPEPSTGLFALAAMTAGISRRLRNRRQSNKA